MTRFTQVLTRGTTAALSTALLVAAAPAGAQPVGLPGTQPVSQAEDGVPDSRRIVRHTVRSGDTATGLAVRFHAWTDELIALNHLGRDAALQVGQRLRIPVVRTAVSRPQQSRSHDPGRPGVRTRVVRTATRLDVDPQLALAIAWQESGWRMDRVSSAGAIGVMQVIPGTGRWMSQYAGRRLHLHRLRDNVTAGVLLIRVLNAMTSSRGNQIAGYYQGVGAVRAHGWFDDTRRYVANVRAIKHRLERGLPPA